MATARLEQNMNHGGPSPADGKGNPGTGYDMFWYKFVRLYFEPWIQITIKKRKRKYNVTILWL